MDLLSELSWLCYGEVSPISPQLSVLLVEGMGLC